MSEEKLDVKISGNTEQLTTALKQAMTALQDTSKITKTLENTSRDLKNMFDLLSREVSGMSEDNKRMMDSNKALASSNDKLKESVSELKDGTKRLQSSNRELISSNDRFKSAGEDLIKSMGRMSSAVSRNTEAATKNAQASDKAASSSKSFYDRIQDAYGRVKKFGQELMQCYQAIEQYVVKVAELADQAKAIGASAEGYQKLAYAARETGTDMGAVSNAFQNVQKAMEQAQAGNEAMRDAIASLGLDLDRLFALSPDDRFAAIAEALSEIRDPAERSRIGVALLGEDFAKLNDYLDGFGSLSEQAKKDFDFIDEKTISASKEYVENMERLDRAFTALVASNIAQTLADATEGMLRLNQLSANTGNSWLGIKEVLDQAEKIVDDKPWLKLLAPVKNLYDGNKLFDLATKNKYKSPVEQLQRQAGAAPTKQELDDARKVRDERLKAQAERQRKRDENAKAREAKRKEAEEAITGRFRQRTEADAARQAEREERERQRAAERAARDEQTRKDRLFGAETALASAEMRLADLKARHKEAAARRETNALLKELDRQQRALDDQRKAQTAEPTTPAERLKRRRDIRLDASIAEKTALRNAGERVRFTKAEERRRKELKLLDAKEDDIRQRRSRIQERQQRRQERAEKRQERRQMQEARKRVREARRRVAELQPDGKASAGQAASDAAPVAAFAPSPLAVGVAGTTAAATGPSAIGQQLSAIQAILTQMSTKFYFVQG